VEDQHKAWHARVVHDTMTSRTRWNARFVSGRILFRAVSFVDESQCTEQRSEEGACCVGQVHTMDLWLGRGSGLTASACGPFDSAPGARVQLLIRGGDAGCGLMQQEAQFKSLRRSVAASALC
jgi:hypothetical protein